MNQKQSVNSDCIHIGFVLWCRHDFNHIFKNLYILHTYHCNCIIVKSSYAHDHCCTAGEEIKQEPNLEYGMVSDSIPTEPNPLYGMRSDSTPLQVVVSESITNELHPVNGVSESSTGTRHISTSPTTGDN